MLRQPLANKYRPRNFSQIKGQDILVTILSNAIVTNKIANAYLITGIRGVGKTTTARIVAKTINCSNIAIENSIPTPCEKCPNCVSSNNFSHPDILEIDAASKTGVNDIREIIENARYKPLLGKYKIYIIDEMHMLSNSAFNALLKTLEEPPADVLFIFATTEAQKIPATIISRCQRFDLARFSLQDIVANLTEIAQKENIQHEKDSLNLLAKFSEGSVRDSLSLLETINLYKKCDSISISLINEVLGIPNIDTSYELLSNIISGNAEQALNLLNTLYIQGSDLGLIMEELLEITNKVSKALVSQNFIERISMFDHEKHLLNEIKNSCDLTKITNIWKILFGGLSELKISLHPIRVFEMAIIRACHLSKLPSLDSVIKKVITTSITPSTAENSAPQSLNSFKDVVALFYKNKEIILYKYLIENIKIIKYSTNRIEAEALKGLPDNFATNITSLLRQWTGEKWEFILIKSHSDTSTKTFKEQEVEAIKNHELVKAVHAAFPGTEINKITKINTN